MDRYEELRRSDILVEVGKAAERASQIDSARADEAMANGELAKAQIFTAASRANISLATELISSVKLELGTI